MQLQVGDRIEPVRFFHSYKRGVDRVFVDHPMFLEKVSIEYRLMNFPEFWCMLPVNPSNGYKLIDMNAFDLCCLGLGKNWIYALWPQGWERLQGQPVAVQFVVPSNA